ncbi:hypothetical protein CYMTET_8992 [Cymbomonas tetramitiformis]|uniref:SGNH hydrolase-type esterase domain-containing protein n=1 Tax=Cymbomonas tetramitiformis TaxID=36881 RepID=A0AAE0LFB2_9CHLO|nr:hypothetical protein CYMTET_8992 [Cymbomonas tetramitiformis]
MNCCDRGPPMSFSTIFQELYMSFFPDNIEGIVAVGGSFLGDWDWLAKAVAPLPLYNHAISGTLMDATYASMDFQVVQSQPRLVVYCNGGDDILQNVPAEKIAGNFSEYCERLHKHCPATNILFMSILNTVKQSRSGRSDEIVKANSLIKDMCDKTDHVHFLELNFVLLERDGRYKENIFSIFNDHTPTNKVFYATYHILYPATKMVWESAGGKHFKDNEHWWPEA